MITEEVKDKIDGLATKDEHRKLMTMVENTYTEVKKMREEQSAHHVRTFQVVYY